MPFDGSTAHESLPIEVRLLDRARELLQSDQHWLRKQFNSVGPDGRLSYCLYGALFRAERELVNQLSVNQLSDLMVVQGTVTSLWIAIKYGVAVAGGSSAFAINKKTAFGRTHEALNRIARPKWAFWSQRHDWAMNYNDSVAKSVRDIHCLIDKSRAYFMAQHDLAVR
jgi:hypothetical protein